MIRSQGVTTPNANTYLTGLLSSLYEWQKDLLPIINEWTSHQKSLNATHGINIVLRDFTDAEFAETVIRKNYEISE